MVKIGVFDSGIGGKSVAERLHVLFPAVEILFVSDSANVPYGSRDKAEIICLTEDAIMPLLNAGCDAIVIACNTATTNAITDLRANHPDVHFVGIEPMVKPAATLTKTGAIAVLATPSTLSSQRYADLKEQWASGIAVDEPDCSTWASLIETGRSDEIDVNRTVDKLLAHNVDVIVLGCTHYHWIKDRIQMAAGPDIAVLEPSDAIGARLNSLLSIDSALPE